MEKQITTIVPIKSTLRDALTEKLVEHIRDRKPGQLLKQVIELFAGLLVGAVVVAPHQMSELGIFLLSANEYVLPKVVLFVGFFFLRKRIRRLFRRIKRNSEREKVEAEDSLIENIPVRELADYLMRNKNFKREGTNGVRETFGLNMEKFNKLAALLERKKILTRGENNMRVLDGRWSRQALIDYLAQEEAGDGWFRIFKINDPAAKVRLDNTEIAEAA